MNGSLKTQSPPGFDFETCSFAELHPRPDGLKVLSGPSWDLLSNPGLKLPGLSYRAAARQKSNGYW
jgi:hypothetical protein